jgi:hypothetical protein
MNETIRCRPTGPPPFAQRSSLTRFIVTVPPKLAAVVYA